jgi:rhamnosyltransferase
LSVEPPQSRAALPYRAVAGIVTFYPDPDSLVALVGAVASEVATVMVFANSDVPEPLVARLRAGVGAASEFVLLAPGGNVGLGVAYDAFVAEAQSRGAEFLLLLDQDSMPEPHMVARLAAQHRTLALAGENPVLVGPQPIDPSGERMKVPLLRAITMGQGGTVPVRFAISSGSLLRLDAAAVVGPFRADFFIDAIDLEWCMRAWSRGYSVWIAPEVLMPHRLGLGVIRLPGGLRLTDQPPRRLYTYIRNQLAMTRLRHVPMSHKVRLLASLPIRLITYLGHNRFSRDICRALVNGLIDGALNRLGPPDPALRPIWSRRSGRG